MSFSHLNSQSSFRGLKFPSLRWDLSSERWAEWGPAWGSPRPDTTPFRQGFLPAAYSSCGSHALHWCFYKVIQSFRVLTTQQPMFFPEHSAGMSHMKGSGGASKKVWKLLSRRGNWIWMWPQNYLLVPETNIFTCLTPLTKSENRKVLGIWVFWLFH